MACCVMMGGANPAQTVHAGAHFCDDALSPTYSWNATMLLNSSRHVFRSALTVLGLLGWSAWTQAAEPQPEALPQRNLLVEVRQRDADHSQDASAGIQRGDVEIRSSGEVRTRVDGGVQVRSQSRSAATVQQLWVLNGSRASLRLSQSVPLRWWQAVLVPSGAGPSASMQILPSTIWTEAGQALSVQPSWRGAPQDAATVAIYAEQVQALDPHQTVGVAGPFHSSAAARQTATLLSTVQAPLGTWITVANSVQDQTQRQSGVVGLRQSQGQRQRWIEIRVTAPGSP